MISFRLTINLLLVVVLFWACNAAETTEPLTKSVNQGNQGNSRLTIIISDLHIGPGKYDNQPEKWMNIEDFRWKTEFIAFMDFINAESNGNTDLVILGDMFELWQSANMECEGEGKTLKCTVIDCEPDDKNLGCTEEEALERTKRIIGQHKTLFEKLRTFVFADDATNRIIIVPGNHDAALLYPRVAQEVISEIIAGPVTETDCIDNNKVCISRKDFWMSSDKRIYADHGHAYDKANRFDNWPNPFVKRENINYILRPGGEQLVQKFYNTYEERYPILDNLENESDGILLGFRTEGLGMVDAFAEFAKFLFTKISLEQLIDITGKEKEGQIPEWDFNKIIQKDSPLFLIETIPSDDPLSEIAKEAHMQNKFGLKPSMLTRDELQDICDYKLLRNKKDSKVAICPSTDDTAGGGYDRIFKRQKANLSAHLLNVYDELKSENPTLTPFPFYIYGHTHKSSKGEPLTVEKPEEFSWSLKVLNTGAFQRVVDKEQLEGIKKQRSSQGVKLKDKDILVKLRPEDLPACYTFVRIDTNKDGKAQDPVLRYWVKEKEGHWAQSEKCEWQ